MTGLASLLAAGFLASHHPLWPAAMPVAMIAWAALIFWRPGLWLGAVPALLPLLNFSPWTGWLIFDEFDLLILATLAGGFFRLASDDPPGWWARFIRERRPTLALALGLGASAGIGLVRGWADTGFGAPGWFQGYTDPLNSLRLAKAPFFALLLLPLLERELRDSVAVAVRRFCVGMWIGAAIVAAAVLWERFSHPGLFDFSSTYRTTALFWEMHVGGAALDVYVAMATPFVAWAVWSARSPVGWLASAVLTVAWGYVCLTTFSRGVYIAVVLSLSLLALMVWILRLRPGARWRRAGDWGLAVALLLELGLVAGGGSFFGERVGASQHDLSSRMAHWADGLRLLHTPTDWLLGLGSGRLPAHYASEAPRGEFPGGARFMVQPTSVELRGPQHLPGLDGSYGLTQRVRLLPHLTYTVDIDVRARTDADLSLLVCEMHLLYWRHCQGAGLRLQGGQNMPWQRLSVPLRGPSLDPGPWFAPRLGVLILSVHNALGIVDVTDLNLHAPGQVGLLKNGRFGEGLARWFPLAQRDFLPWHIDNLFLETLIERGLLGLLTSAALFSFAIASALHGRTRALPFAAFLAAAVIGAVLVGAVSSVMDVPRVAFLFCFSALFGTLLTSRKSATTPA